MLLTRRTPQHFKPGDAKPKKSGRKKGIPNKATQEIKELAQNLVNNPKYRKSLEQRLIEGKAPQIEVFLWQHAYGRPKEVIELHPNLSSLSDEELNFLETIAKRIS